MFSLYSGSYESFASKSLENLIKKWIVCDKNVSTVLKLHLKNSRQRENVKLKDGLTVFTINAIIA